MPVSKRGRYAVVGLLAAVPLVFTSATAWAEPDSSGRSSSPGVDPEDQASGRYEAALSVAIEGPAASGEMAKADADDDCVAGSPRIP